MLTKNDEINEKITLNKIDVHSKLIFSSIAIRNLKETEVSANFAALASQLDPGTNYFGKTHSGQEDNRDSGTIIYHSGGLVDRDLVFTR